MRLVVASSATCLAPFSQNSKCERSRSGSGQAQPGQSTPPGWLIFNRVRTPRISPISDETVFSVAFIAGSPPAAFGVSTSSDIGIHRLHGFHGFQNPCILCLKPVPRKQYMIHSRPLRSLFLYLLSVVAFVNIVNAQVKPGRDPNQPIDQEYTNKIREYTTAT